MYGHVFVHVHWLNALNPSFNYSLVNKPQLAGFTKRTFIYLVLHYILNKTLNSQFYALRMNCKSSHGGNCCLRRFYSVPLFQMGCWWPPSEWKVAAPWPNRSPKNTSPAQCPAIAGHSPDRQRDNSMKLERTRKLPKRHSDFNKMWPSSRWERMATSVLH